MHVKPLYNRVLVSRLDPNNDEVRGQIIIPETAKEKSMEGKIVAVGAGKLDKSGGRVPLQVKVGDRVLIGRYSGHEITIENVEHLILKEDEILGIIG